jgi:hypothetical protein
VTERQNQEETEHAGTSLVIDLDGALAHRRLVASMLAEDRQIRRQGLRFDVRYCQPRACKLSMMPRNSTAAENSPLCSNTVRIAAGSGRGVVCLHLGVRSAGRLRWTRRGCRVSPNGIARRTDRPAEP